MHAYALVMGGMLSHPWAANVVTQAQRVVTFFRASHKCLSDLNEAKSALRIKAGLVTSNKTRFTSVEQCLTSVQRMEPALRMVVGAQGSTVKREVAAIIRSPSFWAKLGVLLKLLEPISQVIMAVQGAQTTFGDTVRYWMYLGRAIQEVVNSDDFEQLVPPGKRASAAACCRLACRWHQLNFAWDRALADYALHICVKYNERSIEMDSSLCKLALFLDPRYKGALKLDPDQFEALANEVILAAH